MRFSAKIYALLLRSMYNELSFIFKVLLQIMTFKKGMTRPEGAGMPKGGKTKRSQETAEIYARIVEKHGDPLLAMAEMAFDQTLDATIRHNSLREVTKYGHAQKRAVELTGLDGGPLQIDARLGLINQITEAISKLNSK